MGVKWTEEQQKVISLRDRNILVSAAAGSGKTAVLVERILSKITDPEAPVDIDRLLIMTFTRAAAGEMKERISSAIESALYEDPDNEHLQRQSTLLHTAQITTIDGFCAYIIRNYFHLIGLDPGYRTADEGELKLLREDVTGKLLEDYYSEKQEKYKKFVECFASGKDDEALGGMIQKLYEMAMSNPFPEEWLDACLDDYKIETTEELRETKCIKLLWKAVVDELETAEHLAREARKLCDAPDGPNLYGEALDSDLLFIRKLKKTAEERDYNVLAQLLEKPSFARLSGKKMPEADEQKKQRIKELREEEKEILKELGQKYFQGTEEEILDMLKCSREPLEMLVELTRQFAERFGKAKREKNILDFTDMEHFALKILMKKEDGQMQMSQAAIELSEKYEEVLVDEYQDSNLVQELLTTAVSGWVNQRKNIFMVGDEDQSIYGFRAAYPEALLEFEKTYPNGKILLMEENFRSNGEIVVAADRFIQKNTLRHKKKMKAFRPNNNKIRLIDIKTRKGQYKYLEKVATDCENETAVLYRDNESILPVIDLLEQNNIPYKIKNKDLTFFTNKVVMDIENIINFSKDQTNTEMFMQIYFKINTYVGKVVAEKACVISKEKNISLLDAVLQCPQTPKGTVKSVKEIKLHMKNLANENGASGLFRIINAMGYKDYL